MAFTGFSSDEEGSIVFDGEQFIINNPDNVPPDFDPGDRPVIYTRPPAPYAYSIGTGCCAESIAFWHRRQRLLASSVGVHTSGVYHSQVRQKHLDVGATDSPPQPGTIPRQRCCSSTTKAPFLSRLLTRFPTSLSFGYIDSEPSAGLCSA